MSMLRILHRSLGILIFLLGCHASQAQLISYQFPIEFPTSGVWKATVAGQAIPALKTERGAFLSFGMRGPVEVVVKLAKPPKDVVIRPLSAEIKPEIRGDTVRFLLPRPMNLSVEADGNLDDPLFVFANPELENPPDRKDPKVRYFEGGRIHDAGEILLGDGETLYLEGGAVVRGVVRARNARNVAVRGPGILDASQRKHKINMLVLRECRDALLENFILLDPLGWSIHLSGSENIRLFNTRVIGWRATEARIKMCGEGALPLCGWGGESLPWASARWRLSPPPSCRGGEDGGDGAGVFR